MSVRLVYLQIILAGMAILDFMGFILSDFVRITNVSKRVFALASSFNKMMTFLSKLLTTAWIHFFTTPFIIKLFSLRYDSKP